MACQWPSRSCRFGLVMQQTATTLCGPILRCGAILFIYLSIVYLVPLLRRILYSPKKKRCNINCKIRSQRRLPSDGDVIVIVIDGAHNASSINILVDKGTTTASTARALLVAGAYLRVTGNIDFSLNGPARNSLISIESHFSVDCNHMLLIDRSIKHRHCWRRWQSGLCRENLCQITRCCCRCRLSRLLKWSHVMSNFGFCVVRQNAIFILCVY